MQDAIRTGKQVLICGPTLTDTKDIITPLINEISEDAPEGFVKRTKSENIWRIGEGTLRISGFDTVVEKGARGKGFVNVYLEESGFSNSDTYEYVINSVLKPTLLHSKGKILHFTTPSPMVDHPLHLVTLPKCEATGSLFRFDIWSNPLLSKEQIEEAIRKMGGAGSSHCQREYFVQISRDSSLVLIPEFDEKLCVKELEIPEFTHYWTAGDIGGVRDKHCVLLLTYDFLRAKILVVDERSFPKETSSEVIIREVKQMEGVLKIQSRWIDAPGQLRIDMNKQHSFICSLPLKDELEASINLIRVAVSRNEIEISPKCKFLIMTLRSGTFNTNHTDLGRSELLGHMDAIMALCYGMRMKDMRNPYPLYGKQFAAHTHYVNDSEKGKLTKSAQTIKDIFSTRNR